MNQNLADIAGRLFDEKLAVSPPVFPDPRPFRAPVHVVYGGANLFTIGTIEKLERLARASFETYAPNFVELALAMWLRGADTLPVYEDAIQELEFRLADDPERVRAENYAAWFAWTVYERVLEKLQTGAVEDFRIDFEDGYGIRSDDEEDAHAISASDALAATVAAGSAPPFRGFRVKSFQPETYRRAVRTLDLFLANLLEKGGGKLPENFVVNLPKITKTEEVAVLCALLDEFERRRGLPAGAVGVEMMIETPEAVRLLPELAAAAGKRLSSAHFGAFDYTASFGITADHQHLRHDACRFARQLMQLQLAPRGVRLSDSVTTEMPVPVHRGADLSDKQKAENRRAVHAAWRRHFNNVTASLIDGFYQSWDLHPAQLVPRYAALYAFFLESAGEQAARLKNFIGKATQAMLTGNLFDDAASAQGLLNFFLRAAACGAIAETEIADQTGLTLDEIKTGSFVRIMAAKFKV